MKKNIRVLFFNYEYPPLGGGAANATRYIFEKWSDVENLEIDLITSGIEKKYQKETLGKNITIHRLPIGKDPSKLHYQSQKDLIIYAWKAFFLARKLTKEKSFDLSHSFFSVPCGFLSWWFWKTKNIAYLVSLRGADVPGYSDRFTFVYKLLTPLIKTIWRDARFVVSNSQGLKDLALKSAPKQTIDIIYNGIDTQEFFPRKNSTESTKNIIVVSRLTQRKGIEYLVEAMSEVTKIIPSARLILAGDGNSRNDLEEKTRSVGLEKSVIFRGLVPHDLLAQEIYQKADVFVLPSLNEGMSNTMLEALASGLPLIATPTGGSEELILENWNGFVVPMKNSQALAEKIIAILENNDLRVRLGENSRQKAETLSWEKVAENYQELYQKISEKNK